MATRYEAMWDYNERFSDELSFKEGEIFTGNIDESNSGWLIATSTVTGKKGRIPVNYVRIEGEESSEEEEASAGETSEEEPVEGLAPNNQTQKPEKKSQTKKPEKKELPMQPRKKQDKAAALPDKGKEDMASSGDSSSSTGDSSSGDSSSDTSEEEPVKVSVPKKQKKKALVVPSHKQQDKAQKKMSTRQTRDGEPAKVSVAKKQTKKPKKKSRKEPKKKPKKKTKKAALLVVSQQKKDKATALPDKDKVENNEDDDYGESLFSESSWEDSEEARAERRASITTTPVEALVHGDELVPAIGTLCYSSVYGSAWRVARALAYYADGQVLIQYQKSKFICEVADTCLKRVKFNVGGRCLARRQKKMQPATVVDILEEFKTKVKFSGGKLKILASDSLQPLTDEDGLDELVDCSPSEAGQSLMAQAMLVVDHFCYAKYKDGRYFAARVKTVPENGYVTVEYRNYKITATIPVTDVQTILFQMDERCKAMHHKQLTNAVVVEIEDFQKIKVKFLSGRSKVVAANTLRAMPQDAVPTKLMNGILSQKVKGGKISVEEMEHIRMMNDKFRRQSLSPRFSEHQEDFPDIESPTVGEVCHSLNGGRWQVATVLDISGGCAKIQYNKGNVVNSNALLVSLRRVPFQPGARCLARSKSVMTPATVLDILQSLKVKVRFDSGKTKTVLVSTLQPLLGEPMESGAVQVGDRVNINPAVLPAVDDYVYAKYTGNRWFVTKVLAIASDKRAVIVEFKKTKVVKTLPASSLKIIEFQPGARCLARQKKLMTPAIVIDIQDLLKVKVKFGSGRIKVVQLDTLQSLREDDEDDEDDGKGAIRMARAAILKLREQVSPCTNASPSNSAATPPKKNAGDLPHSEKPKMLTPSTQSGNVSAKTQKACMPRKPAKISLSASTAASMATMAATAAKRAFDVDPAFDTVKASGQQVGARCEIEHDGTCYSARIVEIHKKGKAMIDFAISEVVKLDESTDDPLQTALQQYIDGKSFATTKPTKQITNKATTPESVHLSELNSHQVLGLLKQWHLFKFFGERFVEDEIDGDMLTLIEEGDFEREDFANARKYHWKSFWKKLRDAKENGVTLR